MPFSMRLSEQDEKIIRAYADLHGLTVSEFARDAMLERIEDEYDIKRADEAMKEHLKNPVTYTLDDAKKALDL